MHRYPSMIAWLFLVGSVMIGVAILVSFIMAANMARKDVTEDHAGEGTFEVVSPIDDQVADP